MLNHRANNRAIDPNDSVKCAADVEYVDLVFVFTISESHNDPHSGPGAVGRGRQGAGESRAPANIS